MGLVEGIKVVDFTTYAAGPCCARILADWKAEVVKIEPIKGEAFRFWGRLLGAPIQNEENPMFEIDNANKKGMAINLKSDAGQEIIHKLLEDADIFITNYREKALVTLNLTYEKLSINYPRLIYGYLSGFGSDGPLAQNPGFDVISFWAKGGFLGFLGEPEAPPCSPLPGTGDQISGTYLVSGILAALYGREKTGRGEKVETSLYHSGIWSTGLFNTACNYWENPKQSRFTPNAPLINCFKTKDNKWFFTAIMEHERYWPVLCKCIGRSDLADNPDYAVFQNARKNSKKLTAILDEAFATKTMDEWKEICDAADIALDMIFNGHDILADEQALVNDYIRPITMPNGHTVLLPTTPCHFKEEGSLDWNSSPQLGEHTTKILCENGYSKDEIRSLREEGVVF